MKGDSVFVNEWPFYIKELSDNKIIIEAEYFYEDGKYLVEFKRINKASIVEY